MNVESTEPFREELMATIRDMKDDSEINALINKLTQAAFAMGWDAGYEAARSAFAREAFNQQIGEKS